MNMNKRLILAGAGILTALMLFLMFGRVTSFARLSAAQQFPLENMTAQPAPASYSVKTKLSIDQSIQIAQEAVPNSKVTATTELVIFQDKLAYQIILDRALVYVDANTGTILYNNATEPAPQ